MLLFLSFIFDYLLNLVCNLYNFYIFDKLITLSYNTICTTFATAQFYLLENLINNLYSKAQAGRHPRRELGFYLYDNVTLKNKYYL